MTNTATMPRLELPHSLGELDNFLFERAATDANSIVSQALALPFDTLRTHYAKGVKMGIFARSILANRDFEQLLSSVEHMVLGPWARRR